MKMKEKIEKIYEEKGEKGLIDLVSEPISSRSLRDIFMFAWRGNLTRNVMNAVILTRRLSRKHLKYCRLKVGRHTFSDIVFFEKKKRLSFDHLLEISDVLPDYWPFWRDFIEYKKWDLENLITIGREANEKGIDAWEKIVKLLNFKLLSTEQLISLGIEMNSFDLWEGIIKNKKFSPTELMFIGEKCLGNDFCTTEVSILWEIILNIDTARKLFSHNQRLVVWNIMIRKRINHPIIFSSLARLFDWSKFSVREALDKVRIVNDPSIWDNVIKGLYVSGLLGKFPVSKLLEIYSIVDDPEVRDEVRDIIREEIEDRTN